MAEDNELARHREMLENLYRLCANTNVMGDRPSHKDVFADESQSEKYLSALTMELFCNLRHKQCIGPLSFMRNLMSYVSKDKVGMLRLDAASSPGGNITTVRNWLVDQANVTKPVCPSGDVITIFDNDQVVGRTYKVQPNNSVKASVITNVAWVQLDQSGCLQEDDELIPGKWRGDGQSDKLQQAVRSMMRVGHDDGIEKELHHSHKEILTYFVDVAIKEVVAEHAGQGCDVVDKAIEQDRDAKMYVTCIQCNTKVEKRKRKCPICNTDLKKSKEQAASSTSSQSTEQERRQQFFHQGDAHVDHRSKQVEERYKFVPSNHPPDPPKIHVADPVFVNPSSYDALRLVLRQIGTEAGVACYGGTKRKWTIVCCDGLPYKRCLTLIDETFACGACNFSIRGLANIKQHQKNCNPSVPFYREFDWVLLKIGDGHYQMNMFKAFMELNWDVFMSDFCSEFSFKSPLAQASAKRCDDTHKSWAMLLACYLGSLKELVVPHVRECSRTDISPSPADFFQFAKRRRHIPNYSYLYDQTTVYLQAIVNMRFGVRRNNSKLIQSAKWNYKGIFHGRHHPYYAAIEIDDTLKRRLCPTVLGDFLARHESCSKSGNQSTGQGFEFILEELNAETKAWIPRGVPTDEMWQLVCRNLPNLKKLTFTIQEISGITPTNKSAQAYRNLNVSACVEAVRKRLRESRYLLNEDLEHTSLSGKVLHQNLSSFQRLAEKKRADRLAAMYLNGTEDSMPVFITPDEEAFLTSVERLSIPKLKLKILNCITQVELEDLKVQLMGDYNRLQSKNKPDLLKFYQEITELVLENPSDEVD